MAIAKSLLNMTIGFINRLIHNFLLLYAVVAQKTTIFSQIDHNKLKEIF